ncbi:MAG: response regulator [Bacteroidetes bacterium]|nr:response regulator [Bacteroidota bacterium]
MRKVNCIMLIDDSDSDNYYHEHVIRKNKSAETLVVRESAEEALEYLKSARSKGDPNPDIIFLDIHMPGMNGWQFLEEYNKLDKELQGRVIVVMLTTLANPADKERAANAGSLTKYRTKPLTAKTLDEVYDEHFKEITNLL